MNSEDSHETVHVYWHELYFFSGTLAIFRKTKKKKKKKIRHLVQIITVICTYLSLKELLIQNPNTASQSQYNINKQTPDEATLN